MNDFELQLKYLTLAGVDVPDDITEDNFNEKISPQIVLMANIKLSLQFINKKYMNNDSVLTCMEKYADVTLECIKNGSVDLLNMDCYKK